MQHPENAPARPLRRSGLNANAAVDWLRQLDPRVRLGAALVAVLLILGGILAIANAGSAPTTVAVSPTPTVLASPTATSAPTAPRPRQTPPGTPAPRPKTFVIISASVPVSVPPAPRATATPEPGLWRLEGYLVDESGKPIENVCVVIGPVSCQPFSPKTDERGHYFVDIAAVNTQTIPINYDFYFEYPGRETIWLRMTPSGSTTFNAVLKKST